MLYFLLHAFSFGVHKRILSSNTFNDDAASLLNSPVPKEEESIKFFNSICLNYDLIAIWRTRNPDRKH